MPYTFYKVLHILSLILLFSGLMSLLALTWSRAEVKPQLKKFAFISHGLGLFFLLLSGFGMAARLGYVQGLPNWIYAKLVIWLLLGAGISLAKRFGHLGALNAIVFWVLGTLAAYLAVYKPF